MTKFIRLLGVIASISCMIYVLFFTGVSDTLSADAHVIDDSDPIPLMGSGTEEDPYIIDSYDDLKLFRDLVNNGESFSQKHILQTKNIDLNNEEWLPIGIFDSGMYFDGIYDGGGHYIDNLYISSDYPYSPKNVGFFGLLTGTVKNFGIENGYIEGGHIGSICSHGSGLILNCYNKATIVGEFRAGGIADNFSGGRVIGCVNLGKITAPVTGVLSYNADLVCAFYPQSLPDTFLGLSYQLPDDSYDSDDVYSMLNEKLTKLIELGIIQKEDVVMWQE